MTIIGSGDGMNVSDQGGVRDEEEKGAEEGSTAEVHADSPYVDVDYKVHRPRQVH
jgi:hypothetical protein